MRFVVCTTIFFSIFFYGQAQFTRYIIQFTDKSNNPYSLAQPGAYLSQKSIDRRTKYTINLDSTDLPVTPGYIDSIQSAGAVNILNVSKWLNSVTVETADAAALARINNFSFVKKTSPVAARMAFALVDKKQAERDELPLNPLKMDGVTSDFYNYGLSAAQIQIHHGNFLHNIGLRGQNLTIGMLDAGFRSYTALAAFDSVNANHQVLGVFDFVAHDGSVIEDDPHGMECFSTMAANIQGQFVGSAPKADYLLFRTEDVSSEYPIEEHNWVCGAEKVDSAGGDIITSSLGYTTFDNAIFNHSYADMNGRKTMVAIGATLASRKGLIVLNAVGNDGTDTWHYLSTPADADSILAVGSVNAQGAVSSFSSYGPSADGRIKPDVASVGERATIESPTNIVVAGNGTSFATPNLAGLTACLWQGFPEFNNIKIIDAIKQSGSQAGNPDNRIGYGIPDMKKAVIGLLQSFADASATAADCNVTLSWSSKDISSMKYEIERKLPSEANFKNIATVQSKGTSFSNQNYQFLDSAVNTAPGNVTYRVREIIDTTVAGFMADYIASASATIAAQCAITSDIRIIPNPAITNTFRLQITSATRLNHLQIRIFNTLGQEVYNMTTLANAGLNEISVSIPGLAKGKYLVSIYDNARLIGSRNLLKL